MALSFRERLRARARVVGSFIKTPSPILVEVLGLSSLDCLCLDAEHAPFDRLAIDGCALAARAAAMPLLVRPPSAAPEHVLNALDCGAAGVVAPHIRSAAEAEAFARACRYGPDGRGYAGSSRAAGYTTVAMAAHLAASRDVAAIAQIEDVQAVDAIDEIVRVDGIDALFIGRADLTVAYGCTSQDDPVVLAALERVCAAADAAGRAVGLFLARVDDVPLWAARGASLFLLGSDHGFLLAGAADLAARARR